MESIENLPAIPRDDVDREAFWTQHVEAWRAADVSQREYARQHRLPIARFTYWKNKLYPTARGADFVRIDIEAGAPVRIHHATGTVVECLPGTDVNWLRDLLGLADAS